MPEITQLALIRFLQGLRLLPIFPGHVAQGVKFGLYGVGASTTEMLLSGEAEAIGGKDGRFQPTILTDI